MKYSFVKLYSVGIVDGHYIVKVDEMTSIFVQDNPWWHCLLPVNANFTLDHFQKSGVANALLTYNITFSNNNIVIKMCNALKILYRTYY